MNDLKKYVGLLNDIAPKGEFLAYINEEESDLLKSKGAKGLMTPQGIPSYRGEGGYQGGSGSPGSAESSGNSGNNSGNNGGNNDGGGNNNGGGSFDYEGEAYGTPDTIGTDTTGDDARENAIMTGSTLTPDLTPIDPGVAGDWNVNKDTGELEFTPSTDTITSFSDNLTANIKANPLSVLTPTSTLAKTAIQTLAANAMLGNLGYGGLIDGGAENGGDGFTRDELNQLVPYAPFLMSNTIAPESQALKYYSNLGISQDSSISSNLQTDYNNAKNTVNSILGITAPTQQFGYSAQPYGLLSSTNMADNPFNIPYLQQRGLI